MFIPDYVMSLSDESILQSHCCENLKLHNPRCVETKRHDTTTCHHV